MDPAVRLILPPSTRARSLENRSGVKGMASGARPRSLSRRLTSLMIQLETALGSLPWDTQASNRSAKAFSPVMKSASYSGRLYSAI